jgi:cell division protein FtsB
MDATEYQRIKSKADSLQKSIANADMAVEFHLKALKDEFGCATVEDAKELLVKNQEDVAELKERKTKLEAQLSDLTDWNNV